MQVFKTHGEKVNFIDANNVFVGYDLGQSCCENADYFFSATIPENTESEKCSPPGQEYVFDPSYFKENSEVMGDGGMVVFRLTSPEKPEIFLCLYNHQNGYYSHGFEVKVGETVLREGSI